MTPTNPGDDGGGGGETGPEADSAPTPGLSVEPITGPVHVVFNGASGVLHRHRQDRSSGDVQARPSARPPSPAQQRSGSSSLDRWTDRLTRNSFGADGIYSQDRILVAGSNGHMVVARFWQ